MFHVLAVICSGVGWPLAGHCRIYDAEAVRLERRKDRRHDMLVEALRSHVEQLARGGAYESEALQEPT